MCEAHRHHDSEKAVAAPKVADSVTFVVSDMTCSHCADVVTKALKQTLPGAKVEIDLTNSRVTVDGDEVRATEAIRTAGYSPELIAH